MCVIFFFRFTIFFVIGNRWFVIWYRWNRGDRVELCGGSAPPRPSWCAQWVADTVQKKRNCSCWTLIPILNNFFDHYHPSPTINKMNEQTCCFSSSCVVVVVLFLVKSCLFYLYYRLRTILVQRIMMFVCCFVSFELFWSMEWWRWTLERCWWYNELSFSFFSVFSRGRGSRVSVDFVYGLECHVWGWMLWVLEIYRKEV